MLKSYANKTAGYHRHILRHPILLKMCFEQKLPFFVLSISHWLLFHDFEKFRTFFLENFGWKNAFSRNITIYPHSASNLVLLTNV